MRIAEIVDQLRTTSETKLYDPLPLYLISAYEEQLEVRFPGKYREFLQLTNGCEACNGHYRIFGFGPSRSIDVVRWNQTNCWKFAWNGAADKYWCFGETSFG